MTTLRQLIIDAFRESNIVATDEEPEAAELEEAVRRINNIIKTLFGNELGDKFSTVNYGQNDLNNLYAITIDTASDINSTYVPANIRMVFNIASGKTLYLHPNPQDGSRLAVIDNGGNLAGAPIVLDGNGRKIETSNAVTLNTNGLNREWFYRADLGNWQRVTDLDVDDQSPLPESFDDLLSTMLAIRINPRYGAETSQNTTEIFKRMRRQFRARYRQEVFRPSELGLLALPSNKYAYLNWYYSSYDLLNGN